MVEHQTKEDIENEHWETIADFSSMPGGGIPIIEELLEILEKAENLPAKDVV
jgi:hypothetical protein